MITEGKMVLIKAALYAYVAFLTPLAGLLATAADANTQSWPSTLQIAAAVVGAH